MSKEKHSEWHYMRNDQTGNSKFEGLPCPTKNVIKKIGREGVEEIDRMIKEIIEFKKAIYPKESPNLGFDHITFYNHNRKLFVNCFEEMYKPIRSLNPANLYQYPQKISPENYSMIFADELLRVIAHIPEKIQKEKK